MLDVIFQALQVMMMLTLVLGIIWVMGEVLCKSIRKSLRPTDDSRKPIVVAKPKPPRTAGGRGEIPLPHTLPRPRARIHERHR